MPDLRTIRVAATNFSRVRYLKHSQYLMALGIILHVCVVFFRKSRLLDILETFPFPDMTTCKSS